MYFYNGEHVPGVTTILGVISKGDAITQWAVNQTVDFLIPRLQGELSTDDVDELLQDSRYAWKVKKQEAADIGTIAHNWIEDHLRGKQQELPEHPKARNSVEAALKWLETNRWETIAIEDVVFSPTHFYAGKMDWKARVNGVLAVPDWKTSKHIYSSYRYQTAAYVKAIEEITGEYIPDRWLLRIDKETGEFEDLQLTRDTLEEDFATFLGALQIYRREAELRREHGRAKRSQSAANRFDCA